MSIRVIVLLVLALAPAAFAEVAVLAVDHVGRDPQLPPCADVLSVSRVEEGGAFWLRVSFLSLDPDATGVAPAAGRAPAPGTVPVRVTAADGRVLLDDQLVRRDGGYVLARAAADVRRAADPDAIWIPVPADVTAGTVTTTAGESVTFADGRIYAANCALVLHGNQGLGYTDVFHGRWDDPEGSGFDEAMQVHESTGVPGNFHLSGTLQTAAAWSRNEGDVMDFNAWLASGVAAGWAGMVTSAYAQHIMPFVRDEMNDWAVAVESDMIATRYGYQPRVAWVPERVWLNTSGYPASGVTDWIGDDFQPHGVWGVILDDDVHLQGHDNHQIHSLDANGLRLVPRDRSFTGNIVGGNGQAALDILVGLANSGVGEYRIAVAAEDWEAIAEVGGWADTTPNAKETYDWFVNKCATESAWLSTWKLADAISNPNFGGDTFSPTPGTYWEIGGTDGYGGGDNGWYTHWAGWVPWVTGGDGDGSCAGGGNCKNYGTLWNDAANALMAAPENDISRAGWYVMMTNLYETAWHDGMGGPISGWEHNYSGHIKQAMVYAEAAHWAAGEYVTATGAYFSDIDNDGYDEVVMHNDRLFAVIEPAGGRVVNLFVRDGAVLDTAIGADNVNWNGNADYNDANHVGAFSDVGPNYQHDPYALEIVQGAGATVTVRATRNEVVKELSLTEGDAHLDAVYRVGPSTHWIQGGFSPSLVDLVWNAQMERVWAGDAAYMGRRNPNTGVAVAWVLGTAGATHQGELAGTLMKGDEFRAEGTFAVQLFAGVTGEPVGGEIAELRALADDLVDDLGPRPVSADFYPSAPSLVLVFDQAVDIAAVAPAGIGIDADADDMAELTLDAATTVAESGASYTLTLQLTEADAAALGALDPSGLRLLLDAGAVQDTGGVPGPAVTAADQVAVTSHAATLVTIDGRLTPGEWDGYLALADSSDSEWTAANEIDGLYAAWDADYLYLAIDGVVTGNSWLLYLDVDPGGPGGQTDLSAIDTWERGAVFTAPGFAADFQYGCYQHQSPYDGDGLWRITSATTTEAVGDGFLSAHDAAHAYGDQGGSELAIAWDTLFGLGAGQVPPMASISLVASVCWDPEPDGVLGGDVAPGTGAAGLPTVGEVWTITIDDDGDGLPDGWGPTPVLPTAPAGLVLQAPYPNPFNPRTSIAFSLPGEGARPVRLSIYDLRGREVARLVDGPLPAGPHTVAWNGQDHRDRPLPAGVYLCKLVHDGRVATRTLTLVK
jgi:hypothetical protein